MDTINEANSSVFNSTDKGLSDTVEKHSTTVSFVLDTRIHPSTEEKIHQCNMMKEIRQELRRFAETTGIKGVGRIVKTTSKVIRFFWLISILVCFAVLLFQVTKVLGTYTSHTVTRSSKVVQTKPTFPAVTICNIFTANNISSSSYNEYLKRIDTMMQYDLTLNITKLSEMWTYMKSIIFYNVNTPLLEEVRDHNDSFVLRCSQYDWDLYNPEPCKTKTILTTPLQKCHQVELDYTNGTVAAVTVLLFTNNFQSQIIDGYNPWIRTSAATGASVMIHPKGTLPSPKTKIKVSAGNELTIQLTQTKVNRLSQPYGNCTDRDFLIPSQPNSPNYSTKACLSLCRQSQTIEKCRCLDNSEFFTEEQLNLVNRTFCANITQTVNETPLRLEAVKRRLEMMQCQTAFIHNPNACDCPIPCSETSYDTGVSYSQWPDPLYHLSFYKQFIQKNVHYGSKFSIYEEILKKNQSEEETIKQIKSLRLIEDNFLEVLITFGDDTIQEFTDSAAITWDTLVANLGGSFNLWLGICVPTFAEIIELIYSLLVIVCCKKRANVIQVLPDKKPSL